MTRPYVAATETHTGAVLFVGDLAYKVKKPVDVGFLDWTRSQDRVRAIEAELELNRRLAPDVYLGTGILPVPGGDGEPVLIMRRLPDDRRLSTLVRRGADVDATLQQLAAHLARFHRSCAVTEAALRAAGVEATMRRWEINHERMRPAFDRWIDGATAERVRQRAVAYLGGRGDLLASRVAAGWARDGHGDLLAEDVFCLDDGPRVLDCLDFDEQLRVGDVLADVAFLAMDLERLGRPDLGWQLLEHHRDEMGDGWPASLAHHHVAYRAQVRTLVGCVRAEQGHPGAGPDAAALLEIADRHSRAARVRLVLVGGSPGTGKSTLAAGLAAEIGATVLRSDEVRKELVGGTSTTSTGGAVDAGPYGAEWTERTYAELLDRAEALLRGGESVVLDATWASAAHRVAARSCAVRGGAEIIELRCVVALATARARADARARAGCDASDADGAIAAEIAGRFEQWPEAVEVSTATSVAASVDAALDVLA
jgi:uncharacterized protein